MREPIVLFLILGLAACGSGGQAGAGAGGVTSGEAKALDDAAEMVEQQRLPDDALRPPAPSGEQAAPARPAPAK